LGINFFDTANVYAIGQAERVVGEALHKYPRESYVLATKVFWPMGSGVNDRGLSRKHVFEQAHASLKRLGVDYVDIYYCHRYDPETPVYETLRVIDDLIRQGKVLYAGVSEWTAAQIQKRCTWPTGTCWIALWSTSRCTTCLTVRSKARSSLVRTQRHRPGGLLTAGAGYTDRKYKDPKSLPAGSRATDPKANNFIGGYLNATTLGQVAQLNQIAAGLGIPMPQFALAWVLRQANVASALIGASRPAQSRKTSRPRGSCFLQTSSSRSKASCTARSLSRPEDFGTVKIQPGSGWGQSPCPGRVPGPQADWTAGQAGSATKCRLQVVL
jgi:aryl-alcohol dehydrogenase-like predicted oxidoreductase